MAAEVVVDLPEETARELERIRREVLFAKEELRVCFENYSRILRDKHLELVAQLDELAHIAVTKAEERQLKLNQLKTTKADVSHNLQHNELNETLINVLRELDMNICILESIVDEIPCVCLQWNDKWFESGIAGLCRLCVNKSYVNRQKQVWSGIKRGNGFMEICNPFGLSIDSDNGDIFVCDSLAVRIQVFSKEGIHLRTIKPQEINHPSFIAISQHHLFVSCFPQCLYKLDKLSGDILCCISTEHGMRGLSVDTDTLYTVMLKSNYISHLSVEDLSSVNVTSLNSPYNRGY